MKEIAKRFFRKAKTVQLDGIGVIEIILILVIIIGLVIIFKDQITNLIQLIFDDIFNDTELITD